MREIKFLDAGTSSEYFCCGRVIYRSHSRFGSTERTRAVQAKSQRIREQSQLFLFSRLQVFNDLNTYYQDLCTLEDCAVRVMTTVVSTCVPGQVIVDAASKVFSYDLLSAGPKRGFGRIVEIEGAGLSKLNEEHGFVAAEDYGALSVGQVVSVIPNHVCTCRNMHDDVFVSRAARSSGRGRLLHEAKFDEMALPRASRPKPANWLSDI